MNVFEYITANNNEAAYRLCSEYGIACQDDAEVAETLAEIATTDDEGLKRVMEIHPEKEVMVALFAKKKAREFFHNYAGKGYGCASCPMDNAYISAYPAAGTTSAMNPFAGNNPGMLAAVNQTNTLLLIGIIAMIGAAVMITNKK